MHVNIFGVFLSPTGYGRNGREFAKWLWKEGVKVSLKTNERAIKSQLGISEEDFNLISFLLKNNFAENGINMTVWTPDNFLESYGIDIGYTMTEASGIPKEWVRKCNRMEEVWVPSSASVLAFVESGVKEDKVKQVMYGIDTDILAPNRFNTDFFEDRQIDLNGYKFLLDADWIPRKAIKETIRSYLRAFKDVEKVILILKTFKTGGIYTGGTENIGETISQLRKEENSFRPKIFWITSILSDEEIAHLYSSVDCVVLCSKGEGVGLPPIQGMAMEKPYIASKVAGMEDFISDETGYVIGTIGEVYQDKTGTISDYIYDGFTFRQPDFEQLEKVFRHVFENQEEAKEKGKEGRKYVVGNLSWEVRVKEFTKRLSELCRKTYYYAPYIKIKNMPLLYRKKAKEKFEKLGKKIVMEVPSLGDEGSEVFRFAHRLGLELSSMANDDITLSGIVATVFPDPFRKDIPDILWRVIDEADLIHVHYTHPYPYDLKKLKRKFSDKLLTATLHEVIPGEMGLLDEIFDKVVVPFSFMKVNIIDKIDERKVYVIPYACSDNAKEVSLRPKIKKIGIVCTKETNPNFVIKAINDYDEFRYELILVCLDDIIKEVKLFLSQIGRDAIVTDKINKLNEVDLIILPLVETGKIKSSYLLRECMEFSKPLVASDVTATGEFIENTTGKFAGVTVVGEFVGVFDKFLLKPQKEKDLYDLIRKLDKNVVLRYNIVENFRKVASKSSWRTIANAYIDFWGKYE